MPGNSLTLHLIWRSKCHARFNALTSQPEMKAGSDHSWQRRGRENHDRAGYRDLDCAGSTYYRHQGRLGDHDDRSETGGWIISGASSHHWSGRAGNPPL